MWSRFKRPRLPIAIPSTTNSTAGVIHMGECWRFGCRSPVAKTDDLGLCESCKALLRDDAYVRTVEDWERRPGP